ncbi:hypothetical protein MA16_Dca002343 [Dendrobium catenatum]|uniref:Uncharacterized protein n=1 Tax=Dendrobium catenatum TaxID=906689 RepID=A0A2I0W085_9ASPA|nr:hypothetical protein MA16_Dca002343 [Dendrobium catenatum]
MGTFPPAEEPSGGKAEDGKADAIEKKRKKKSSGLAEGRVKKRDQKGARVEATSSKFLKLNIQKTWHDYSLRKLQGLRNEI